MTNFLLRHTVNSRRRSSSGIVIDSSTLGLGAHYMNQPSGPSYASTPAQAGFAPASLSIDLQTKVRMTTWTPSGNQFLLANWNAGADTRYAMFIDNAGKLNAAWYRSGAVFTGSASTIATGFTNGTDHWVRALINPATGTINYYTSTDATSWTALGTQVTATAGAVQTPGTAQPLTTGATAGGAGTMIGRVYAAHLLIGGVSLAAVDFSTQTTGATSFIGATGETWTLQGSASIV